MKRFSNIVDKNKKKNMIGISCITASAIIISSAIIFSFPSINFASIQEDMFNNEIANNSIIEEKVVEEENAISENTVAENVVDNSVLVEDKTENEVTNTEDIEVTETKETKLTYAVTNEDTGETTVVKGEDGQAEENSEPITEEVLENEEKESADVKPETFPELIFPVGDVNDIVAGFFGYDNHAGIDFKAEEGTEIKAAASGTVVYSAYKGSYGNLVVIDHGNGTQTYYAHCSELYISIGQTINQGDVIATVGATGNTTGQCLHFELRINGNPVNPLPYIKK